MESPVVARKVDDHLMEIVRTRDTRNWLRIAEELCFARPSRCRERYHRFLKPSLSHNLITAEEGVQIERLVHETGKNWSVIASHLSRRSEGMVRIWWERGRRQRAVKLARLAY